ncbi:MAG: transketolase [Selenomonadaceae bacterium]|nr:transketolase [Selenomonadaceae bacterium]
MNLKKKAFELRKDVVEMIYRAKSGHIGGDFSLMEILVDLYYKQMNLTPENFKDADHDRFILSKGHAIEALYVVLADRGFFPKEDLDTFGTFGSKYIGHPTNKVNGIEMNTGSLGHGLGVGVGMALAGKMDGKNYRVYVVMGDGEVAEGSVWEAAMAGSHYKLDNLTAFVDRNHLQISGTTEQVMNLKSQENRWAAFGWNVISIPGNDLDAVDNAVALAKKIKDKPTVIIAHTVKGFGVSFMEDKLVWHHRVPNDDEYQAALQELERRGARYE